MARWPNSRKREVLGENEPGELVTSMAILIGGHCCEDKMASSEWNPQLVGIMLAGVGKGPSSGSECRVRVVQVSTARAFLGSSRTQGRFA